MSEIYISQELAEIKLMLTQIRKQIEALTPNKISVGADEAAKMIGVSKTTMYKLLENHELKYSLVGGRRVIKRSELDDYLTWKEIEGKNRKRRPRH